MNVSWEVLVVTEHYTAMLPVILTQQKVQSTSYSSTDPDRPLEIQEVEDPRIARQSVHEGGKVVSSIYRSPLPPAIIPDTHFI